MDGIPERRPPKDQATAWATPRRAGTIHRHLKLGATTRVPLLRVQDRGDPVAQVAGLGQLLHTQEHRTPIEQHLPTFSSSLEMERTKWVVQSPRLWMVDNESAQLAQYAANLPWVTLRRQSPPILTGTLRLQLVGYLVEESAETLSNACIVSCCLAKHSVTTTDERF